MGPREGEGVSECSDQAAITMRSDTALEILGRCESRYDIAIIFTFMSLQLTASVAMESRSQE